MSSIVQNDTSVKRGGIKWSSFSHLGEFLWPAARNLRGRIIGSFVCLLLAQLVSLALPLFYGKAIDYLNLGEKDYFLFLWLIGAFALGRVLQLGISELRSILFTPLLYRAMRQLSLQVHQHLHKLSLNYHLSRKTGSLNRILDRGTKAIEFLLEFALFNMAPTALQVLLVGLVLGYLFGWYFIVLSIGTIVAYALFTIWVTRKRIIIRREMNEADQRVGMVSNDGLINYETVKYFNAEKHELRRLDLALERFEKHSVATRFSLSWLNFGQAVILGIGTMLILGLGGYLVVYGDASTGDFVAMNTYLLQLFLPLGFLGTIYREIYQAAADMEHLWGIYDENPEVEEQSEVELSAGEGSVEFRSVGFAYQQRQVLGNLSFKAQAGKMLAVVGPTGAGKSTLLRLLFRFYDPQQGQILVNGQDIKAVSLRSLRQRLGVVPQDCVLFNDTLRYNVAYGKQDASDAEIVEAMAAAKLDEFIDKLPEGLDTVVGERGLKLSGGERQRVAIARAVLKSPDIFIFDEATSSLDNKTEQDIKDSLNRLAVSRTTIVVAHRLSTIQNADMIIVLDEGAVVEQGTHQQLLAQKGLYYRLSLLAKQADDVMVC